MELTKGFYLVNSAGEIRTKNVRKKLEKGGFEVVEVPICLRTIGAAKDFVSCLDDYAVLAVTTDNFTWGE